MSLVESSITSTWFIVSHIRILLLQIIPFVCLFGTKIIGTDITIPTIHAHFNLTNLHGPEIPSIVNDYELVILWLCLL